MTPTYDRDYIYIRDRPILHTTARRDWVCGTCESPLKGIWQDSLMITVCARDASHPVDGFIHQSALERRVHRELMFGHALAEKERRTMSRLKDRDREDAPGVPLRLRLGRVGKIRQGVMAKNKDGRDYPLATPYFIIEPATTIKEDKYRILSEVRAAIDALVPGQDLEKPTVLPIIFLINDDAMIAPESYKLRRGKKGTVWCAGNGETILWKLDDQFRVEVSQGVHVKTGEILRCPGGDRDHERHPWCEECNGEFELNFAIQGYDRSGVWLLRTKSMNFRDQFWPQLAIARGFVQRGVVPTLADVPFLLRRQKESITAPVGANKGLSTVEMPITSIEIEPGFLKWARGRQQRMVQALQAGEVLALSSGEEGWPEDEEDGYIDGEVDVLPETMEEANKPADEPAPPQPKPEPKKPAPRASKLAPSPREAAPRRGAQAKEKQDQPVDEKAPPPPTNPETLKTSINWVTSGKYDTVGDVLKALRRIFSNNKYTWPVNEPEAYPELLTLLVQDHQASEDAKKDK